VFGAPGNSHFRDNKMASELVLQGCLRKDTGRRLPKASFTAFQDGSHLCSPLPCLCQLTCCSGCFSLTPPVHSATPTRGAGQASRPLQDKMPVKQRWLPVVICSAGMLALAVLNFSTTILPRLSIKGGLAGFPMVMNNWTGQSDVMGSEIIASSGAEEALSAVYSTDRKHLVSVYVGYRGSPFSEVLISFIAQACVFHRPGGRSSLQRVIK